MKISQIITEKHVKKEFIDDNIDELFHYLNTDYSESWKQFIKEGKKAGIFRSELADYSDIIYKTPLKERKAAYAKLNIHNSYINEHSNWSEYPQRSVIASNSLEMISRRYGPNYFVFPKNATKIGVCPAADIFDSYYKMDVDCLGMFYEVLNEDFLLVLSYFAAHSLNSKPKQFNKDDTLSDVIAKCEEYDKLVKEIRSNPDRFTGKVDDYIVNAHHFSIADYILGEKTFKEYQDSYLRPFPLDVISNGFVNEFERVFSNPNGAGFKLGSYTDIAGLDSDIELWFDAPAIMINVGIIDDVMERFEN